MQWGQYRPGGLVAARMGLQEPQEPWLPTGAVADAAVVFVPALAVDRAGVRLGRGAGFYDRTLSLARSSARLVAVVRDDELVDEIPAEPHDIPMTHALTPGLGLVALG
jgi:5-formyltetrahydrofolate cyclo-ligase